MEETKTVSLYVYVTTWGLYNAGKLGFYVDLTDYANHGEFMIGITEKHNGHDPEWQFQNISGLPDSLVNEDSVSPMVFDWIKLTEEERDLLTAWIDAVGDKLTDITLDLITASEDLHGKYDSERDGWEELADELLSYDEIKIPTWLVVDYEATWKASLRHDYSTSEHDGSFWIFRNK